MKTNYFKQTISLSLFLLISVLSLKAQQTTAPTMLDTSKINNRRPVHDNVNAMYKIENGKIEVSRTMYNEADDLRQPGYHFSKAE